MSPTGLARQGTRKLGSLGRTATLTRQATMSLSTAGGKRAQALEGLKQQVEDLKTKLQVENRLSVACCAREMHTQDCQRVGAAGGGPQDQAAGQDLLVSSLLCPMHAYR